MKHLGDTFPKYMQRSVKSDQDCTVSFVPFNGTPSINGLVCVRVMSFIFSPFRPLVRALAVHIDKTEPPQYILNVLNGFKLQFCGVKL